jgi:hypothetical protein
MEVIFPELYDHTAQDDPVLFFCHLQFGALRQDTSAGGFVRQRSISPHLETLE